MATLTFDRVGLIGILCLAEDAPTDEEWDALVAFSAAGVEDDSRFCLLAISEGGAPKVMQRAKLSQALTQASPTGKNITKGAVCTDSLVVRGAVTAFAWLGAPIRSFKLTEVEEAVRSFELSNVDLAAVKSTVARLEQDLAK